MSDLQPLNHGIWDRLFDLLYPCDEMATDADVDAALRQAGIDIRPAVRRLRQMIQERNARATLADARQARPGIVGRLRDVVAPGVEDLRAGVRQLINRLFTGSELAAHHHKLERTATDQDLKTMLDDLARLAQLREQKKDDPASK